MQGVRVSVGVKCGPRIHEAASPSPARPCVCEGGGLMLVVGVSVGKLSGPRIQDVASPSPAWPGG
eukprot:13068-Chlamydomonas_euryale.AAC.1